MVDCHSFSVTLSPVKNVTAIEINNDHREEKLTFVLVTHVVAWMRYVIRAAVHCANKKEIAREKKNGRRRNSIRKTKGRIDGEKKNTQKNFQIN